MIAELRRSWLAVVVCACLLGSCSSNESASDAGLTDAGVVDAGNVDAGFTDVPPTVTIGILPTVYAAVPAKFSASAASTIVAATQAGFAFDIAWGDHTADFTMAAVAGQSSVESVSHTYAATGTYTLKVTSTDKFGGVGSSSVSFTVATLPTDCQGCLGVVCQDEVTPCSADSSCKSAYRNFFLCLQDFDGGSVHTCEPEFANMGSLEATLGTCINGAIPAGGGQCTSACTF
jgi:hypothetical protein